MADIEILSLHFDSESIISYPPSIIMKHSSSTTLILPIPDLFTATSFNICNIQPCPKPYPPAAHHPTYIIARQFRFSHPHPCIPRDIWRITTHPTPLLHSGMCVTMQEYGVVDIWELLNIRVGGILVHRLEDRQKIDMPGCWLELGGVVNLGHGASLFHIIVEGFYSAMA
jgi:hypothetical protein